MSSIIEKYSRALKLYRDDGISVPVLPSEMRTLIADFLALKEHCAALESREVCTVAHENVETCGYCQRDRFAAAARKATCNRCRGMQMVYDPRCITERSACPDCADLRRAMGVQNDNY